MLNQIKNKIIGISPDVKAGIMLVLSAIAAILITNSNLSEFYHRSLSLLIPIDLPLLKHKLSLLDLINEGLMSIFFFVIGLELKKELMVGELSSKKRAMLPVIAAFGGVLVPMFIFSLFNSNIDKNMTGIAIPTATDIAFAYGIISLFGSRISESLKIFIVALAVIDDLIAILIIALFYSKEIDFFYLIASLGLLTPLFLLNIKQHRYLTSYIAIGVLLWICVINSGIHATVAGIITAFFLPLKIKKEEILHKTATKLMPMINFIILPIFAFANSNIEFSAFSKDKMLEPLNLGIALGLFFGKQIGVSGLSFLAIKLKIAHLPRQSNWLQFYATSIFTGIGFTMSIFIASLAFEDQLMLNQAKAAIVLGSLCSVLIGTLMIKYCRRP